MNETPSPAYAYDDPMATKAADCALAILSDLCGGGAARAQRRALAALVPFVYLLLGFLREDNLFVGEVKESTHILPFSPTEMVFNGTTWHEIDIPKIFGPKQETMGKGLIVVPGHGGNLKRLEIIRNNTRHIPFERFDCVVFLYADLNVTDGFDLGGCKVVHKKGSWVDFQYMVKPSLVQKAGYISVTLMLDDVLIAPSSLVVNSYEGFMLDRMSYLLQTYKLSSLSPNVFGSDKSQMSVGLGPLDITTDPPKLTIKRHLNGFIDAPMNEIQFVMFHVSDSGWPCFHSLLEPELNPIGWGPDLCYKRFCNAKLGLVDAAVIHYGRPTVYGNLPTTNTINTSYTEAEMQMKRWALNHKRKTASLDWPDDGLGIFRRCGWGF